MELTPCSSHTHAYEAAAPQTRPPAANRATQRAGHGRHDLVGTAGCGSAHQHPLSPGLRKREDPKRGPRPYTRLLKTRQREMKEPQSREMCPADKILEPERKRGVLEPPGLRQLAEHTLAEPTALSVLAGPLAGRAFSKSFCGHLIPRRAPQTTHLQTRGLPASVPSRPLDIKRQPGFDVRLLQRDQIPCVGI